MPTTIQKLQLTADQVTREKVGVEVTGLAVYRIVDPLLAFRMRISRSRSARSRSSRNSSWTCSRAPVLAAAFQQRMGEVHVTAVDGANPFGYIAAAVEGVMGLARATGLEGPSGARRRPSCLQRARSTPAGLEACRGDGAAMERMAR